MEKCWICYRSGDDSKYTNKHPFRNLNREAKTYLENKMHSNHICLSCFSSHARCSVDHGDEGPCKSQKRKFTFFRFDDQAEYDKYTDSFVCQADLIQPTLNYMLKQLKKEFNELFNRYSKSTGKSRKDLLHLIGDIPIVYTLWVARESRDQMCFGGGEWYRVFDEI